MPKIRSVKRSEFEKFLRYIGCELVRVKGDHFVYRKPGLARPIVLTKSKDVPELHIRTNLKTLGISTKQFLDIITK